MKIPSLNNLLLGSQYIGIEHFSSNNEEKIAFLLVEKKKEELVITQKNKLTYSDTLPDKLDKKLPFYLVINNNQVIQKEITETDASDEKLLHKSFPNVAWNEFYYEIWRLKTKSFIAIGRKTYVNEIVSKYKKQGVSIVGISLGVCTITEMVNYTKKKELTTNHQSISLNEENQIINTRVNDLAVDLDINGLSIQNSHVLAFASLLRLLQNFTSTSGNLVDYNRQLHDDYNQKSFFYKGMQTIIGVLLTILLINFFVFNNYYKKSQDISEKLLLGNSSKEVIKATKDRIIEKEKQLYNATGSSSVKSSLLINQITNKVPPSILLSELTFSPIEKKVKTEEVIIFQEKTIIIVGTTLSNEDFTKWIEQMEKLNFIDKVVITGFGKNEVSETIFSVKLILKKNETK
jgi:hypothetical protein